MFTEDRRILFISRIEKEVFKVTGLKPEMYKKCGDNLVPVTRVADAPKELRVYGAYTGFRSLGDSKYLVFVEGHGVFSVQYMDPIGNDQVRIDFGNSKNLLVSRRITIYAFAKKSLYCMPFKYLTLGDLDQAASIYTANETEINDEKSIITVDPTFNEAVRLPVYKPPPHSIHRFVFSCTNNLKEMRTIISETDERFLELKKYTVESTGKTFLVSRRFDHAELIQLISERFHSFMKVSEVTILCVNPSLQSCHQVLSTAMMADFVGKEAVYVPFLQYVASCAAIGVELIMARLFHLVQSSGTGKTKLCLHLIADCGRGLYSVYRSDGSLGFPPTTPWARELKTRFDKSASDELSVQICLAFVLAAVKTFSTYRGKDILRFYAGAAEVIDGRAMEKEFDSACKMTQGQLIKALESSTSLMGAFFPIVMDECDSLLVHPDNKIYRITLYRAFRRAMGKISHLPIVAICLGTKSSLNDFVLNSRIDPSYRPQGSVANVQPYIFVHSFDVMLNGHTYLIDYGTLSSVSRMHLSLPLILKSIARLSGRPLWSTYSTFEEAIHCGRLKLCCDGDLAYLTALVLRTQAPIVPQDPLAHRLVLSGMAMLQYVDSRGERCHVTFPAEPVLSSAARTFVGTLDNLKRGLAGYCRQVDLGAISDLGEAGEFVARIVLLRAMDQLGEVPNDQRDSDLWSAVSDDWIKSNQEGKAYARSPSAKLAFPGLYICKLRVFLKMLGGGMSESELKKLKLSENMLNGFVNLSQFIKCKNPSRFDQLFLLNGFARSVGFILPNGSPGADLIVPVYRVDDTMSCIAVQVKNLNSQGIPDQKTQVAQEIINKLTADYIELNLNAALKNEFAKLVIQFKPKGSKDLKKPKKSVVACAKGEKGNILWLMGLDSFAHLFSDDEGDFDHDIRHQLQTIIDGPRDFINYIADVQPFLSKSQNTPIGIKTLLFTHTPLQTSTYLTATHGDAKKLYPADHEQLLKDLAEADIPSSELNGINITINKPQSKSKK